MWRDDLDTSCTLTAARTAGGALPLDEGWRCMIATDHMTIVLLASMGCLTGLAIILLLARVARRRRERKKAMPAVQQPTAAKPAAADPPAPQFVVRRHTILEQVEGITQANRKQVRALLATMVDSGDWQELGQQIIAISDQRIEHMRVLAQRHDSSLTAERAMSHTFEAYRLSLLIFALHDELIEQSDVVRQLLDEWFRSTRGIGLAEFGARVNMDCARLLLLDLDYARPLAPVAENQLDLAAEHCASAAESGHGKNSTCDSLRAEITLRKERLST